MATTQFEHIYHGGGKVLGRIRFSSVGLGWKPMDEGATVTIPADQMVAFQWLRYVDVLMQCGAPVSAHSEPAVRVRRGDACLL